MKKILATGVIMAGLSASSHAQDLTPRASEQFSDYLAGRSYEAEVFPQNNTGAPFTRQSAGPIAEESVAGGVLTFRTENTGGNTLYWYADPASQTWWQDNADPAKGYTVEFRLQALTGDYSFNFVASYNDPDFQFRSLSIQGNRILWGNIVLGTFINDNDFHVYRLVNLPDSSVFQLYRDGVLISDSLLGTTTATNRFWFGDWSGDKGGGVLDYLRWDTSGAYSPIPEPSTLLAILFGLFLIVSARRRRNRN